MKPMQHSMIPAAAAAAGVLLPSWMPNRRATSAALFAGASALADVTRGEEYMQLVVVPDVPGLSKDQMRQVHAGIGYLVKTTLMQGAVEVTRLLSTKDRVAGAAVLCGLYMVGASQVIALVEKVKAGQADQADDDAENDVVAAHAS